MNVQLFPARLAGTVAAIPSKSDAHRALICAALADQPTRLILDGELSEDMHATGRCLAALGGTILPVSGGVEVSPIREVPKAPLLDCGESGSTLRFILPVAASLCDGFSMIGRGRLPERPLGALCTAMEAGGCTFSAHALPLSVSGRLTSGEYALPGNISSQYISGLLLAFPMLPQESRIRLTAPLESSGYVAMTLSVMRRFGADAQWCADGFRCSGGGYVSPGALEIEGDWSNAAFWLAARSLGHALTVTGLCNTSSQPDRQAGALVDGMPGSFAHPGCARGICRRGNAFPACGAAALEGERPAACSGRGPCPPWRGRFGNAGCACCARPRRPSRRMHGVKLWGSPYGNGLGHCRTRCG